MSLQNLLEMEELSAAPPPKPRPRPMPRGGGGPPAFSQVTGKRERAIDDDDGDDGNGNYDKVMSISPSGGSGGSPGAGVDVDAGAGGGKRVAFQRRSTGNSFDNEAFIGEEDDGDNSSATFTIENERESVPAVKVIKKPPIPKPKRRETPPTQIAKEKKGKEDYLAVDIGEDGGDEGKVEVEQGGEPEVDSDKGSVTSGSVISGGGGGSKQSVKSRFGKLFKVSKKKSNDGGGDVIGGGDEVTTATTPTEQSEATEGSGESGKGRKGLFGSGRWKKTFSRSTSKPLPEEDEEENRGEEEEEKGKPPDVKKKREKFSKRDEDTRIFMPEEEEGIGKDEKMEPEVEEESSEEDEGRRHLKVEKKPSEPKRSSKFKPLAKLVIRKGKEKGGAGKKKGTPPPPPPQVEKFTSGSSEESEEERVDGDADVPTTSANEGQLKSPVMKRRQRRKSVPEVVTDSKSGKDLLFGVTIHCSDLLPLDPNVIHPVVKVTVMYQNGKFMRKGGGGGDSQMSPSNTGGGGRSSKSKTSRRRRRGGGDDEEEKVMEEEDNNGDNDKITTSNLGKAVLPIMTQPCQARHSIPTFAPTWNELLVFEEPFKRFTKKTGSQESPDKQPIVFFEVMDFLPMSGPSLEGGSSSSQQFHGSDPGWYKVCWGFLKPIGANGHLNLNRKLRLQLYKPVKLKKLPKNRHASPEVYLWWKEKQREKVTSTLWVTPKGILPPETKSASLRQLLSMRKEQLTQAILDSQLAPKMRDRRGKGPSRDIYSEDYPDENSPIWSRISGQSCKPPNKLVATLPSSQIESLNITISGNVHTLKFSPCGNYLACALDTDDLHVILIFGVPSWKLLKTLKGHHGLIYELSWNILEDDKQNFCRHFLASASGDATCRIWKMEDGRVKTLKLFKVLYHPSYVYSAKWHPWSNYPMLSTCLLATSCFDWVIRVWLIQPEGDKQEEEEINKKKKRDTPSKLLRSQQGHHDASPIILLDKHNSFVNCLLFDAEGHHMFSGDGTSCLLKWSCGRGRGARPPLKKNSWRLEKDVKLHSASIPINSLSLHPSGSRLLVHLRDNLLKILDVVTLIPLQSFPGLDNSSLQISSCFSPCGNLVLSGSEDATLLIWDADTGKILQISPQPPGASSSKNCYVACVDYHPFDFYVGVGIASKMISEPSPVLIHFYEPPHQLNTNKASLQMNYPILKKTAMKFRQSIEKEESSLQNHPPTKRVDSSEKFMAIIKKLDTALYFAQQRNKKRRSEATSSNCVQYSGGATATSTDNPSKGEEEDMEGTGGNLEGEKPPRKYTQKRYRKEERPRRPQSASQILERSSSRSPSIPPRRREGFRRSHDSGTKSDSEQSYQMKGEQDKMQILQVAPPPPKPIKRRSIEKI